MVLILANADTALVFLGHIFVASLPTIQSWWAWVRCQGKMAPEATPMVVAAETRLPVPGLEGLLLLVGRLYGWKTRAKKKKPVPHKKNARFRKAGKMVVRLNQVTKLLQRQHGRIGARNATEAKLHRIASVKELEGILAAAGDDANDTGSNGQVSPPQRRTSRMKRASLSAGRLEYQAKNGRKTAMHEGEIAPLAFQAVRNFFQGEQKKRKHKSSRHHHHHHHHRHRRRKKKGRTQAAMSVVDEANDEEIEALGSMRRTSSLRSIAGARGPMKAWAARSQRPSARVHTFRGSVSLRKAKEETRPSRGRSRSVSLPQRRDTSVFGDVHGGQQRRSQRKPAQITTARSKPVFGRYGGT